MSSIFPDLNVGGIAVVDATGRATGAPGMINAYIPPSSFSVACALNYYGTNCATTFFDPTIVNALSSELLGLAVAFNESGTWQCNSLTNLGALFSAWTQSTASTGLIGIIDIEIAVWMRAHFNLLDYVSAGRGVRIVAPGIIQSDLGTGVRPVLV